MSFTFIIPGALRELTGDRSAVRVDGSASSVAGALDLLWSTCPAIRDRILTEQGEVRRHVNVFVNGANIRDSGGLPAPISDGAEVMIIAAVSGG